MDELRDIEARRDANVANLRRAFAALPGEDGRFAALLRRLAAKEAAPLAAGAAATLERGAAPWGRAGAET